MKITYQLKYNPAQDSLDSVTRYIVETLSKDLKYIVQFRSA